jgi:hypothetical protein
MDNTPPDDYPRDRLDCAEPYWMQDIRLALRRLEVSRLAARSTSDDQATLEAGLEDGPS